MRRASGLLLAVVLAGGTLSARAAPMTWPGASPRPSASRPSCATASRTCKDIDTREAARKEAADALKQSESSISRINLRLRELAEANRQAQADLGSLEKQIGAQQATLAKRRVELADQLRTQYTSGLSPWTALLSGDDPQLLGRNLGYLDYVSQARAQAVQALRADIDRLAALQGKADARRAEIEKWWPRPPSRRPPWSASRKSAPRCWPSWKGRSPPSAPRPTSWAGTTSACRA